MKTFILSGIVSLFLLAGCDTVNSVQSPARPHPNVIADQRIISDLYLHDYLTVGEIIGSTASGLKRISTTLTNNRDLTLNITYNIEWLDVNGIAIPSPTNGWKRLRFSGHESLSLSEVAISPDAVDFRIKFKQN